MGAAGIRPPCPPDRPAPTWQVGLDTQYLLARMRTPTQTLEAETFEESKSRTRGLHFLSVQEGPEADQPDGFWLLRDMEAATRARPRGR